MARVNFTDGRVRRLGRRRKHHYGGNTVRRVMPQRPKKPPSAFNLFVRAYFRTAMSRNFNSNVQAMRYAGEFWRTNLELHDQYERQRAAAHSTFLRDLADYKRRMQVVKRPGNAYIYFAREMWQNNRGNRTIREFGQYAGGTWRRMNADERQPYVERAMQARTQHQQMLDSIHNRTTRIEDYFPPGDAEQPGNETADAVVQT